MAVLGLTRRSSGRRSARLRAVGPAALGAVVVLLLLGSVLHLLTGGRWFVVSSPSMGVAAPIGTFVVTRPADLADLKVGDVISFRIAERGPVYTHRIVALRADRTLETRGDLNGADDGWVVRPSLVVGRAILLVPDLGRLIRVLPFLLLGGITVVGGSLLIRSPSRRALVRTVGATILAAIACSVEHPLNGFQVLTTRQVDGGLAATAVSTGLLPIRLGDGGPVLTSGQTATVVLHAMHGRYRLDPQLALEPWQWVLLVLAWCTPLIWLLVRGVPDDRAVEEEERPDGGALGAHAERVAALR